MVGGRLRLELLREARLYDLERDHLVARLRFVCHRECSFSCEVRWSRTTLGLRSDQHSQAVAFLLEEVFWSEAVVLRSGSATCAICNRLTQQVFLKLFKKTARSEIPAINLQGRRKPERRVGSPARQRHAAYVELSPHLRIGHEDFRRGAIVVAVIAAITLRR